MAKVTVEMEDVIGQFEKYDAEIKRLREALHTIFCNTEPDAIKHRDYDHLAKNICDTARAALEGTE